MGHLWNLAGFWNYVPKPKHLHCAVRKSGRSEPSKHHVPSKNLSVRPSEDPANLAWARLSLVLACLSVDWQAAGREGWLFDEAERQNRSQRVEG